LASDDHGLIKRLVFKLIKKHIAGSTSASLIRTVKQLNDKSVSATVTFLNENAATPLKIRYNINSYTEIIKQLSRLNLNAEISLRLSQFGYFHNKEQAIGALDEVVSVAEKYGKRLWLETENGIIQSNLFDLKERYGNFDGIGVEVPTFYISRYSNGTIPKPLMSYKYVKLLTSYATEPIANAKKSKPAMESDELVCSRYMIKLASNSIDTTVFSHDEKMLAKLMQHSKNYKKHLRFEVPLGYNRKRFGMMLKSDYKMSVYVAYGKDWVPYAINKLTEGRIREIAKALLDGKPVSGNGA